jgi:hypothetical protein
VYAASYDENLVVDMKVVVVFSIVSHRIKSVDEYCGVE